MRKRRMRKKKMRKKTNPIQMQKKNLKGKDVLRKKRMTKKKMKKKILMIIVSMNHQGKRQKITRYVKIYCST